MWTFKELEIWRNYLNEVTLNSAAQVWEQEQKIACKKVGQYMYCLIIQRMSCPVSAELKKF